MRLAVVLSGAILISLYAVPAQTDTLELDYASLYSHTRKLDSETMPALQFAFGFAHQQRQGLCKIERVFIHTPKQDIPLRVKPGQRFTLPSERALKLAKAVVNVELNDNVDDCDMSVQLETTEEYLKTHYNLQELRDLQHQYVAFFDKMGGMLAFLMPAVQGLVIHFEQQPTVAIKTDGQTETPAIIDKQLRLSKQWLSEQDRGVLQLPAKPKRIVAWVE